jgi:hypothetical protein
LNRAASLLDQAKPLADRPSCGEQLLRDRLARARRGDTRGDTKPEAGDAPKLPDPEVAAKQPAPALAMAACDWCPLGEHFRVATGRAGRRAR